MQLSLSGLYYWPRLFLFPIKIPRLQFPFRCIFISVRPCLNMLACHWASALILLAWNFYFRWFLRLRGIFAVALCLNVCACAHARPCTTLSAHHHALLSVWICVSKAHCVRSYSSCFVRLHFHKPHQIYCPFCSSILRKGNVIKMDRAPYAPPLLYLLDFIRQIELRSVKKRGAERKSRVRRLFSLSFPPLQHWTHSSCLSFIYNDFGNSVSPATQPVTQPNPIKWL